MLFWLMAAALLALALVLLLPPLLRHGVRRDGEIERRHAALLAARDAGVLSPAEYAAKRASLGDGEPPPRRPPRRLLAAALALALPLGAVLIYLSVGEPDGLNVSGRGPATSADALASGDAPAPTLSLEQATAGLAERLRASPEDLGGWMLLGRAYKTLERFDAAREALAEAHRLAPEDPDVIVEYAEALTLASDNRRVDGESAQLLDRALALDPDNARGLWLRGIQAYQDQRWGDAVAAWEHLLATLPADSEIRSTLIERIADARSRGGQPAPSTPTASTDAVAASAGSGAGSAGADGNALTVHVEIAPELASRVGAGDTLFVFARAPQGPKMPLAIRRMAAGELPVTVVLDDSTSMMPQLKLSSMPEIVVGARVSRSGQATPQAGDLEALSPPVSSARTEPLRIVIDRVVP